jgi:hypothetical protein
MVRVALVGAVFSDPLTADGAEVLAAATAAKERPGRDAEHHHSAASEPNHFRHVSIVVDRRPPCKLLAQVLDPAKDGFFVAEVRIALEHIAVP